MQIKNRKVIHIARYMLDGETLCKPCAERLGLDVDKLEVIGAQHLKRTRFLYNCKECVAIANDTHLGINLRENNRE